MHKDGSFPFFFKRVPLVSTLFLTADITAGVYHPLIFVLVVENFCISEFISKRKSSKFEINKENEHLNRYKSIF